MKNIFTGIGNRHKATTTKEPEEIFLINTESKKMRYLTKNEKKSGKIDFSKYCPIGYDEIREKYISSRVIESYRANVSRCTQLDFVLQEVSPKRRFCFTYKINADNEKDNFECIYRSLNEVYVECSIRKKEKANCLQEK